MLAEEQPVRQRAGEVQQEVPAGRPAGAPARELAEALIEQPAPGVTGQILESGEDDLAENPAKSQPVRAQQTAQPTIRLQTAIPLLEKSGTQEADMRLKNV